MATGGRITIPAELRQKYEIKPGDRVKFDEVDGRVVIRPIATSDQQSASSPSTMQDEGH